MKIAFIVSSLAKMGPIRVVFELVKEYQKIKEEVCVYYFDEKKGFDFPCTTIKIGFFEKIKFDDFDIIHTHGIRPDLYVFYHKSSMKQTKCITTLHNYVKKDLSYQYNPLIAFIFSYVWNLATIKHDAIVVLSNDAKNYYMSFWKNKKIHVIYNGIKIYKKVKGIEKNKLSNMKIELGVIGLLTKRKGYDQLIRVLSNNSNFILTIIGDGKERKSLEALVENLKVGIQVNFLGYQADAEKYLQLFDLFLMPSRAEGFPIALLEAARAKKAIVCSNIAIHKEVFTEEEVSFFELENIESLERAILKAFKYQKTFENNIHNKFINNYTSGIMAKRYIDLYSKLTE